MTAPPPPLVDYSDSDSDPDSDPDPTPPAKPPVVLPPLPSRFHDLYAVAPRIGSQDDPSLHGGRKRAIPHVSGNWPTHVFVEWHLSRPEFDLLDAVYRAACTALEGGSGEGGGREGGGKGKGKGALQLHSHLVSELGSELPLHMSLSRPNVLSTAQREGFMELMEERLDKARVKPFNITFGGFEWVCNSDGTRWFFVLKARRGDGELPRLLQVANHTFEAFGQPALYGSGGVGALDGFHVSLAWSLEKPGKAAMERVREAVMKEGACGRRVVAEVGMRVEMVKVKVGNAVNVVELKSREERGVKKRRLSYE